MPVGLWEQAHNCLLHFHLSQRDPLHLIFPSLGGNPVPLSLCGSVNRWHKGFRVQPSDGCVLSLLSAMFQESLLSVSSWPVSLYNMGYILCEAVVSHEPLPRIFFF